MLVTINNLIEKYNALFELLLERKEQVIKFKGIYRKGDLLVNGSGFYQISPQYRKRLITTFRSCYIHGIRDKESPCKRHHR